ncbi:uncharacterized protein LOC115626420 isoform X2 [Scaptodrosophila lebanonensis]|uniref:Uncharacterized protein LOC115626420 isoform X2 n=1 Tax=Drosophila lebanonensis TaxID=7225 RepID=A0A6J2TNM6_DROLE|nr:uncharacterized protein LOC115626420 isoform X2 [Scaptodrosophila lebanonensis]
MPCRTNAGSCENHGDVTSAKDTSNQLVIDLDGDKGDNPAIELNHCFLTDVEVSHKQITDRFVELLNLFDSYTQIVVDEQNSNNNVKPIALRRSQSELMKRRDNQHEDLTKTSASLGNIKLSDLTLMPAKKSTCEVSIQTSRSLLKEKLMKLKPKWTEKLQQPNVQGYFIPKPQHTLHIEVESVSSATEFQRARLRVRLWKSITTGFYRAMLIRMRSLNAGWLPCPCK